ncbi:MAG TPA: hypothetical protein VJP79_07410, partial [Nitrososphaera sp.]|nr:hypothetical protein [Nitrososphaera sp.]
MMGDWRFRKVVNLVVIATLLSNGLLFAVLPSLFQKAFAEASLKFNAATSLNGMVFYVTEGQTLNIPFQAIGTLTYSQLPPGAQITQSTVTLGGTTLTSATLIWKPQNLIGEMNPEDITPDNPPSAPYLVKLFASEQGSYAEARISIIVRSSSYSQPPPEIHLDKPTYKLGDTVVGTIEDPNGLCNYISRDFSTDLVSIRVLKEKPVAGAAKLTLLPDEITPAMDGSGDIRIETHLTNNEIPGINLLLASRGVQGNLNFTLTYDRAACPGSSGLAGSEEVVIPVRSAQISFEHPQYAIGEMPKVEVTGTPQTGTLTAAAYDAWGRQTISSLPVDMISPGSYLIDLAGANEIDLLKSDLIRASFEYTITDSGDVYRFKSIAETKILERGLKLDRPANVESNDGIVITLKDPALNSDRNSAQVIDLGYISSVGGTTVSSGVIPQFLVETGPDTAIFSNPVYLYFSSVGDPEPSGKFISIDRSQSTTLRLSAAANSYTTTIEPYETLGSPEGTGSTSENPPAAPRYGGSEGVDLS